MRVPKHECRRPPEVLRSGVGLTDESLIAKFLPKTGVLQMLSGSHLAHELESRRKSCLSNGYHLFFTRHAACVARAAFGIRRLLVRPSAQCMARRRHGAPRHFCVSRVTTRSGSLLAGTVTKYVLLVFNIGAGIVLMPFTVAHLGRSQYGLWMLVASMTTYFQLLDIGYGNGVVRHLVEADARNDVDEVHTIARTF